MRGSRVLWWREGNHHLDVEQHAFSGGDVDGAALVGSVRMSEADIVAPRRERDRSGEWGRVDALSVHVNVRPGLCHDSE